MWKGRERKPANLRSVASAPDVRAPDGRKPGHSGVGRLDPASGGLRGDDDAGIAQAFDGRGVLAADLLWTITSLRTWEDLVLQRGWTAAPYEERIGGLLLEALAPGATGAGS